MLYDIRLKVNLDLIAVFNISVNSCNGIISDSLDILVTGFPLMPEVFSFYVFFMYL